MESIWTTYAADNTGFVQRLSSTAQISPLTAQVMMNRGVRDMNTAMAYLNANTSAYGRWPGNDQVVISARRIALAIKNRERIIVYGDGDADGITSTCIAVIILRALGANVDYYIPSRLDEGYGLHTSVIDELRINKGAKLIITVDCGIRAVEEALYAQAAGVDLIITDHHNFGDQIPQSFSLINPKDQRDHLTYDDPMLAGSGVAFRFFEFVYQYVVQKKLICPKIDWEELRPNIEQIVMIGTVADLVDMNKPYNRALVKGGLDAYARQPFMPIQILAHMANLKSSRINSGNIGFNIAPRINAAGRLAHPNIALWLLMANDEAEALKQAQELDDLNVKRQSLTQEAFDEARMVLGDELENNPFMVMAISNNFPDGILGLVAGKFSQLYHRPAFGIRIHENGQAGGSARSINGFNIVAALDQCKDILHRYGGHSQAAGFSLDAKDIPEFKSRMQAIIEESVAIEDMVPMINIDAEIDINSANETLLGELKVLEPTGQANNAPVFMSRNVLIDKTSTMGKEKQHLRLTFITMSGPLHAVAFNQAHMNGMLGSVQVAYRLGMNEFRGERKLQLEIVDMKGVED